MHKHHGKHYRYRYQLTAPDEFGIIKEIKSRKHLPKPDTFTCFFAGCFLIRRRRQGK